MRAEHGSRRASVGGAGAHERALSCSPHREGFPLRGSSASELKHEIAGSHSVQRLKKEAEEIAENLFIFVYRNMNRYLDAFFAMPYALRVKRCGVSIS